MGEEKPRGRMAWPLRKVLRRQCSPRGLRFLHLECGHTVAARVKYMGVKSQRCERCFLKPVSIQELLKARLTDEENRA